MADLTKEQVQEMGKLAGLEIDDQRAETIASRLGSVLEVLDEIPDEALAGIEPSMKFSAQEGRDA